LHGITRGLRGFKGLFGKLAAPAGSLRRRRPAEMPVQKLEGALAVDRVTAIEELDRGP
jgi:hypothetical protein